MRLAVAQRPVVERRKQAQRHPRQPRPRIEIPHRAQHLLRRYGERRRCPFRPVGRGVRIQLPFVRGRRTRRVLGRCFVEGHRSFVHFAQRFVVGVRHGVEAHRRTVDRVQSLVGAGSCFVHFAQRFVVGVRQGFEVPRRSVDRAQILVGGVREGFEGHRRSVDRAQILVGVGSHFVHFAQRFIVGVRHGVEGHRRFVHFAQRFVDLRRRSI